MELHKMPIKDTLFFFSVQCVYSTKHLWKHHCDYAATTVGTFEEKFVIILKTFNTKFSILSFCTFNT